MKNFLFLIMLIACAAVAQSITVHWSLANSEYIGQTPVGGGEAITDWATDTTFYLVYSSTNNYTSANDFYEQHVSEGTIKGGVAGGADIGAVSGGRHVVEFKNPTSLSNGYYYLFAFKPNDSSQYVVSEAYHYTGGTFAGTTTGSPAELPEVGDFYMPDWMGGTWRAPQTAPEPTALALLALGIAGFALRRKAV